MFDFDPNKDYYQVLWVNEDAWEEEIKKAFRKLAVKHHPDRWWDAEQFKKINEAYQILSDKQKRQQYDQVRKWWFWWFDIWWGGWWFWQADPFSDIFGDIFGDVFGGRWHAQSASSRPRRWQDLQANLNITFAEWYKWTEKEFTYQRYIQCSSCNWSWVSPDSQQNKCSACWWRWVNVQSQQTPFGVMQVQSTCATCRWAGYTNSKPCEQCQWSWLIQKQEKIKVNIPPWIKAWEYLKVPWMWNYWKNWWPAWDLFVKINFSDWHEFKRQWDNLVVNIEIPYYDAVLGGQTTVNHPEWQVKITIPKWLQNWENIVVQWKWFAKWGFGIWNKRWDMIVVPKIKLPKKITKEQEKLFKQLKEIEQK